MGRAWEPPEPGKRLPARLPGVPARARLRFPQAPGGPQGRGLRVTPDGSVLREEGEGARAGGRRGMGTGTGTGTGTGGRGSMARMPRP